MKSMSQRARKGHTVAPELVTDIDSWLRYYEAHNINLVFHNGQMLVIDTKVPVNEAVKAPIKTIIVPKAGDIITILADPFTSLELRVAAEEQYSMLKAKEKEVIQAAQGEYLKLEAELLEAIEVRDSLEDAEERIAATLDIGTRMKALADADEILRDATYPERVMYNENVERQLIFPGTRDDRKTNIERVLIVTSLSAKDRGMPI